MDGTAALWGVAALLFLPGVYVIALNYYAWLFLGVCRGEHHSPFPLLGGLLCAGAVWIVPLDRLHWWAWSPLILDPGCGFLVGLFVYTAIVSKRFETRAGRVGTRSPGRHG